MVTTKRCFLGYHDNHYSDWKLPYSFYTEYKLINLTKFQAKLITLSWDKMLQSAFFVSIAGGIARSNRGKNFWK